MQIIILWLALLLGSWSHNAWTLPFTSVWPGNRYCPVQAFSLISKMGTIIVSTLQVCGENEMRKCM